MKPFSITDLNQDATIDEIIDVRTPAEFQIDHIPGAVNFPVLSNEERIIIGTKYKQESAFEAKKHGAVLIARNIAHHIDTVFKDRPKNWKPLIYCWRGGKRSGAMTHFLRQIGWQAEVLEGGYKNYRAYVVETLQEIPPKYRFQVITGKTGSAKSKILEELIYQGRQVLHLEDLAKHKGSVLGGSLLEEQPSQKYFESQILRKLKEFSTDDIVFIEAESKKIGTLQVPDTLMDSIRKSPCIRIEATIKARVDFLIDDYAYLIKNPSQLLKKLSLLKNIVGKEQLLQWEKHIHGGSWEALVESLLQLHYDRLYERSQENNFDTYASAPVFQTENLTAEGIEDLAQKINASFS
jgi:tRNA 2-selenouridine synthase